MDVKRIIHNSTDDDDSTMHSIQDLLSVHVHHDQDISSNLHNKKIKVHEPLNDFDSNEDDEDDNKTYQKRVWEFTDKRNVNFTSIISSIRVRPKSRLRISLCCMVPMPIMRPALNGDISKLEADFFNGNRDGDHVFYISATDSKGNFQFVDDEVRAS